MKTYNTPVIFTMICFMGVNIHCFAQKKYPEFKKNAFSGLDSSFIHHKVMPSLATWKMKKDMIDLASVYSPFNILVNLRSLGRDRDVMEDAVHLQIKTIAEYAVKKGISLVADLDVRMALPTFEYKYPDELQQMLVLREIELKENDTVEVTFRSRAMRDHYHEPYVVRSGSFVRAYAYNITSYGAINPSSLTEISDNCMVDSTSKDIIQIRIPPSKRNGQTRTTVMVSFTYLYPDIFSPHLMDFQREIIRKYADTPLAGAINDEWGFPAALSEDMISNEYWYSKHRALDYTKRTGRKDMISDILLMYKGIKGQESTRLMAINHFREMSWQRNGALEDNFYHAVKEVFGTEGIVAVHPTWFPYPERREYKKNGLDWWVATRDWAQTDEITPFSVRTALAKKWKSPVWYNMYYRFCLPQGSVNAEDYEQELWSSALAGGRVNNLPNVGVDRILGSDFLRAETRIRLLNYINPSPLDCPVAVVFGHSAAMNWAGPYFEDLGMKLVDSLWSIGIPTDLIPSSEIENFNLLVDKSGWIHYGDQRYAAVILYNPEFEKLSTARFFSGASIGKTHLFRVGNWTMDFNGNVFNSDTVMPKAMTKARSIESILLEVPKILKKRKIYLQTPASRIMEGFGHTSQAPPTTGFCRLIDGTLIQVAGTNDATGDIIDSKMKIGKYNVAFDAVGVAAVRLDKKGSVQALAAGGLKSFKTENFRICLDERVDLALWTNDIGEFEGVIQGWEGDIPSQLLSITKHWMRLNLPVPYPGNDREKLKKVVIDEDLRALSDDSVSFDGTVTDINGNTYQVVKIGKQTWMAENLRTSSYNDGAPIAYPGNNNSEWCNNNAGAYTWYENDSAKYNIPYGKLYNWHSVKKGKICPTGWHVPTDDDWTTVIDYLLETGTTGKNFIGSGNNGHFTSSVLSGKKGFSPLAGGYRHPFGTFFGIDRNGLWWSSSGTQKRLVWNRDTKCLYLVNDCELPANHGLSVRCVK